MRGIERSSTTTSGESVEREVDGLGAVGRLADDLEAGMGADRTPQQPPYQLVVVGQQDAGGGEWVDTIGASIP